jgi:hypothetical protein
MNPVPQTGIFICNASKKGFPVLLLASVLLASTADTRDVARNAEARPKIAHVFFAQQHVLAPDSPYFELVGDLETLVKVHAYSDTGTRSPGVSVRLMLSGKVLGLQLKGASRLPPCPTGSPPGSLPHSRRPGTSPGRPSSP